MTTTQPIPLITSDDGLKATSIENLIQTSLNPELPEVEWLPLTIQQEANKEMIGYGVWQGNDGEYIDWYIITEEQLKLAESINGYNTRRAYSPIPSVSEKEEKQKTAEPDNLEKQSQLSVDEAAWNYNVDLDRINKYDEYAEVDFIAGHNYTIANKGLISRGKVIHELQTSLENSGLDYEQYIQIINKFKNL